MAANENKQEELNTPEKNQEQAQDQPSQAQDRQPLPGDTSGLDHPPLEPNNQAKTEDSTDRQAGGQADRQAGGQADRQADRQGKNAGETDGKERWSDCIFNPRTGEFMGRTAESWGRILLFYLCFYIFLAGMFTLTMWAMLQTLDENTPTVQDRLINPGLVVRPAAEISFNRSDSTTFNDYITSLHTLLESYNDTLQVNNELCLVGEYTEQQEKKEEKKEEKKSVCQLKRSVFRLCSGLHGDPSGLRGDAFGYAQGRPCVFVKMNRVVGLKPGGDPQINCTVKSGRPLKMLYFPSDGRLDKMFFPYYGKKSHVGYVQPLVAVQFLLTKADMALTHSVECRLEGSDLKNNDSRDKNQGRVSFRIRVD